MLFIEGHSQEFWTSDLRVIHKAYLSLSRQTAAAYRTGHYTHEDTEPHYHDTPPYTQSRTYSRYIQYTGYITLQTDGSHLIYELQYNARTHYTQTGAT